MNFFPFKKKQDMNGYVNLTDGHKPLYNPDSLAEAYKPEAQTPSAPDYAKMSKEYMDQYLTRKPFGFDVNADMLYQQYRKQAAENGRMAMEDTMARAAAMTGGYVNSFAQAAGQQAYQRELDAADQMIPELFQLALNRYDAEGQDLLNKASAAASMIPGNTPTEETSKSMSVSDAKIFMENIAEMSPTEQQAYISLLGDQAIPYAPFVNWNDGSSGGIIYELKDAPSTEFEIVDDGGGYGWGINTNAKVKYQGKEYTLAQLRATLKEKYGWSDNRANQWIKAKFPQLHGED